MYIGLGLPQPLFSLILPSIMFIRELSCRNWCPNILSGSLLISINVSYPDDSRLSKFKTMCTRVSKRLFACYSYLRDLSENLKKKYGIYFGEAKARYSSTVWIAKASIMNTFKFWFFSIITIAIYIKYNFIYCFFLINYSIMTYILMFITLFYTLLALTPVTQTHNK